MTDRIGQVFGNYRLTHLLGQGGFADVYLGEHVHLKTQAAIKVLRTQLTSSDVLDFRNEARIIAHLQHPSVVQVLDFGVEDNTPFLVMVYAPGGTLRQRHPRGSQLPAERIVLYVRQVASALQYAHSQKLIHRDIKPENMLLGRNHEVLLSDFGIALLTPSARPHSLFVQGPSDPAGTVTYMAPEQIQGRPSPASDQYALGVVVYEWFTGMPPFQGSYTEIALKHVSVLPPALRERVPTIPPEVEKVVLAALAKDPRYRFASVQAFANALEQACQNQPIPLMMPQTNPAPTGWTNPLREPPAEAALFSPSRPMLRALNPDDPTERRESVSAPLVPPPPPAHTGYGGGGQQVYQSGPPPLFPPPPQLPVNTASGVLVSSPNSVTPVQQPNGQLMLSPGSPAPGNGTATAVSLLRRHRRGFWVVLIVSIVLLLISSGAFTYAQWISPTPTKTLDAFCTALQSRDYQAAYTQLSNRFQNKTPEPLFADFFANVNSCTHGTVIQTGTTATASLTTSAPGQTNSDHVTLVQESGPWKIDDDANLSALTKTLATYCSALQRGDYPTAYSQLSGTLQSKMSAMQLKGFFPNVASCTYGSLTLSAKGARATVMTTTAAGQTVNNLVSLVLDSSNTWKIDDMMNLPDKTLDTFCTALQNKDYQTAYDQLSVAFQGSYPESQFAKDYSTVTSCTHDPATVSNGTVIANVTLSFSGQPYQFTVSLVRDTTGNWKIDNLEYPPAVPLYTFCNALRNHDYQTAYNQTSDGFQNAVPESQFEKAFNKFTSCTYDFPTLTGNIATTTVTFSTSSGQTVSAKAILIQDKNGDWKIDNFQ